MKRPRGGSKRTNRAQTGAAEARATSKSGASQSANAKALHQTVSFALSFTDWAANPPMPPQTSARTMNEILIETCATLAKILACFTMKQALDALNDHITMYGDQMSAAALQDLYKQRDALEAGMKSNGCSRL